ncbi:MAG TPA: CRTAC1 family protein, partial [Abditibacterium sp.]
SFEDVAAKLGVAAVNQSEGVSMGAVWGDYDNDGFPDLLVYKWGRSELFHNDRGQKFSRVADAGLPKWANVNTALWLDYDRDGKLDLFLGGYYPENLDLWHLDSTLTMPDSFEYAQNGGRKYLLRNVGGGRFEDVTEKMGLKSTRWALAATAADLRGTGYPDLFIANDYGVSELFINEGGKRFREVGKQSGIGYAPKSGMNASTGDVLNSGQLAIYVSNITDQSGNLLQYNNLWVPRPAKPDGKPAELHYDNLATSMGLGDGGWSFGAQFGDLNNDGLLDLYLTNGYISADKSSSYWYDYSKIAGGNSAIISDAAHWPAMKGRSLSGYQSKRVWLNDGAGKFHDVAQAVGVTDVHDGRAVALADLWNRGTLDVIVANQRGPLLIYKNSVNPENQWIEFDLEGTRSNRDALGAQVTLFWSGKRQLQEITGGNGFCAQNMRHLHFGLGKNPKIERAVIKWPSGQVQTLTGLQTRRIHHLKEPA